MSIIPCTDHEGCGHCHVCCTRDPNALPDEHPEGSHPAVSVPGMVVSFGFVLTLDIYLLYKYMIYHLILKNVVNKIKRFSDRSANIACTRPSITIWTKKKTRTCEYEQSKSLYISIANKDLSG